ncbi:MULTISPECIES: hypothetical protein [unclassified Halorubrum]|nr:MULTISPECIES: hypothetical protein [unclassified Halorubrum]
MSATTPSVGIDHPTVVPANFDPHDDAVDAAAEETATTDDA